MIVLLLVKNKIDRRSYIDGEVEEIVWDFFFFFGLINGRNVCVKGLAVAAFPGVPKSVFLFK